jgi:hypothetical protein
MTHPQLHLLGFVGSLMVVWGCNGATEPDGAGGAGNLGTGGTASKGSGGQTSALGGSSSAIGGALGTSGGTGATVRRDCSSHADCTLVSATCCGVCGAPTSSDVVALRVDAAAAYRTSVCGTGQVACPACASMANPDLFASCQNSVCTVVDLLNGPLTACSTNADCALRAARCCECGAPMDVWSLVALSSSGESGFAALVCDPATACDACMPVYPATPVPNCSNGHCQLNRLE